MLSSVIEALGQTGRQLDGELGTVLRDRAHLRKEIRQVRIEGRAVDEDLTRKEALVRAARESVRKAEEDLSRLVAARQPGGLEE